MIDPREHNYYTKVLRLYGEGKIRPGHVHDCRLAHDDGCAIFAGGRCDCDPVVTARQLPGIEARGGRHDESLPKANNSTLTPEECAGKRQSEHGPR